MSKGFRNTLLAISLVYILLGLIQIIWPVGSRLVICYILGAALIIYGIYHIIRYFNAAPGYSFPGMGLALGTSCGVIGLLKMRSFSSTTCDLPRLNDMYLRSCFRAMSVIFLGYYNG